MHGLRTAKSPFQDASRTDGHLSIPSIFLPSARSVKQTHDSCKRHEVLAARLTALFTLERQVYIKSVIWRHILGFLVRFVSMRNFRN
jgi:hypothetical protein